MKTEDPKSFVIALAEKIKNHSKALDRQLVNASVILRKRLRDLNDDDRTGVYSPISGNWVTIDLSGIYSMNIVKPTIRANTSALSSANVKIDIKPRFIKDANAEVASQVALSLVEQREREQWTQKLDEYIANEQQLGAGVFLWCGYNPYKKKKRSVRQWDDVDTTSGEAVCPECGYEAVTDGGEAVCPECNAPMEIVSEEQGSMSVPGESQEFNVGGSDTKAYPFWEFRIDESGTQGGSVKNARWFEHHYLASLDELELEYPESADSIRNSGGEWNYALRWQYTLQTGRSVPIDFPTEMPVESREVRDIWLTPNMYLNVELTNDLILKDAKGKIRFKAPKGGTYGDGVFEGEPFDEPPVLCFRIVGNELLDVYPSDFREEYSYISFMSNPSTFWALFNTELITLQDIVNYMLTIQMQHIKRNAITSIVYNRSSFDPEAFNEDLIPTKQDIPPDIPIGDQFAIVPSLTLSGEPMQMLQTVFATKGDITQVQPAMVGETQPGQPYAAQLLQKQQSLGLLSQASLSKAHAKVDWAKRQLKLAQEYWTDEDGEELLKLNGEWTEESIEAFLHCDIDSDIIIDFIQGTDIPTTLMERELKLRQTLTDILGLAQVDPSLIKPETLNEILSELLQAGGIDIDVNDTEADLRLAESRYDKLLEICQSSPVNDSDPAVNKMFAEVILQAPTFSAYPFEGHATMIDFYSDKATQEAAKDEPDYLLLACLEGLMAKQLQAQVIQGQVGTSVQMAIQAPMMQQQQQMQQDQAVQQKQLEDGSKDSERVAQKEDQDMARQDAEAGRQHERQMKMIDLQDKHLDRQQEGKK